MYHTKWKAVLCFHFLYPEWWNEKFLDGHNFNFQSAPGEWTRNWFQRSAWKWIVCVYILYHIHFRTETSPFDIRDTTKSILFPSKSCKTFKSNWSLWTVLCHVWSNGLNSHNLRTVKTLHSSADDNFVGHFLFIFHLYQFKSWICTR